MYNQMDKEIIDKIIDLKNAVSADVREFLSSVPLPCRAAEVYGQYLNTDVVHGEIWSDDVYECTIQTELVTDRITLVVCVLSKGGRELLRGSNRSSARDALISLFYRMWCLKKNKGPSDNLCLLYKELRPYEYERFSSMDPGMQVVDIALPHVLEGDLLEEGIKTDWGRL